MPLKIISVVLEPRYSQLQFLGDLATHQILALTYQNLADSVIRFIAFGQVLRQLHQVILIPQKLMHVPVERRQAVEIP